MSVDAFGSLTALTEQEFEEVLAVATSKSPDMFIDQVLGEENSQTLIDGYGLETAIFLVSGMIIGYTMAVRDVIKAGSL